MPTKFAVADNLVLRQIDRRRILAALNGGQVVAARVTSAFVVPALPNGQDVVQLAFTHDAERVQNLVHESLDNTLDEGLQVG